MEIRRDNVLGLKYTRNITRSDEGSLSVKVVEVEEKEEEEEISGEKPAQGSENTAGSTNGESTKLKQRPRQKQVGGMVIGVEDVSDLAHGFNDLDLSKTTAEPTTPKGHPANVTTKSEHDESVPAAEPKSASLADEPSSATTQQNEKNKTDPIHMFGVLVPQALRQAQGSFVKVVAESIPRLVELDGEMKELEIEIRRTRKILAKQV